MVKSQIAESNIAKDCVLTTSTSGLDTKSSVGMTENTILNGQIHYAACHLTTQSNRTMTVLHKTLTNVNILRRSLMLLTHVNLC